MSDWWTCILLWELEKNILHIGCPHHLLLLLRFAQPVWPHLFQSISYCFIYIIYINIKSAGKTTLCMVFTHCFIPLKYLSCSWYLFICKLYFVSFGCYSMSELTMVPSENKVCARHFEDWARLNYVWLWVFDRIIGWLPDYL